MESKLTKETTEAFAAEVADGLPVEYCCDLLRISRQTYLNWMERGERDQANDIESDFRAFFEAIKNAYASFIKESKRIIRKGEHGWQGAAWWLERTNVNFILKQRVEAGEDGKVTVVIGGKPVQDKPANAPKASR